MEKMTNLIKVFNVNDIESICLAIHVINAIKCKCKQLKNTDTL